MLRQDQVYAMLMLHSRGDNVFSMLPKDVIRHHISMVGYDPNPEGDTAILLGHVLNGNLDECRKMLNDNPRLLLKASNAQAPSGHIIKHATPFEAALGAGDPELAEVIGGYFENILDVEGNPLVSALAERERQYNKYKPHIDAMLEQPAYDFKWLFDVVREASDADVDAALEKEFGNGTVLDDSLAKFRAEFAPKVLSGPCIHNNLKYTVAFFKLYDQRV